MSDPGLVTRLLQEAHEGEEDSFRQVFPLVYAELERLARSVRERRGGEAPSTTYVVQKAFVKMVPEADLDWRDRLHFFRVAARAMRQVLVDSADRRTGEAGRDTDGDLDFPDDTGDMGVRASDIRDLDDALNDLEELSPRQVRLVELRLFAGLPLPEAAEALDVSPADAAADWRLARAWITRRLGRT